MWRKALLLASACCLGFLPAARAQVHADLISPPFRTGVVEECTGTAFVQSDNSNAVDPASGVVATNSMLMGFNRLMVTHIDIDAQSDFPLGLAEVTLARTAILMVAGDDAFGPVLLDVYMPALDATYRVEGQAYIQLAPDPVIQLGFFVNPGVQWLDPAYMFDIVAFFDGQAVLNNDIDKLINDLDSNDWETREAATQALILLGEKALAKVKAALAGGAISLEQRHRLKNILIRILGISLNGDPEWEGPADAGQWNFAFKVHTTAPDVCDIHLMVGYKPASGKKPSAGYDPDALDVQLVGFPDGWGSSYDPERGEIVIECGDFDPEALTPCTVYQIKMSTPTMNKKDPKPVAWYYTNGDGNKIGTPGTKGTIPKGPRF